MAALFTKVTSVQVSVTRLTPGGERLSNHGQGFWLKHDDKTYVVTCAHGGYFADTITVDDVEVAPVFSSPEYDIMLLEGSPASSSVIFTLDDFERAHDTRDMFMNKKRCRYFSEDSTHSALPAMAYTIDGIAIGGQSGAALVNTDNKLVAMIQQYNMSNKTYMAIAAHAIWRCLTDYFTTGKVSFCQMAFMLKKTTNGVEIMDTFGNQYKPKKYNYKQDLLQTGDIITKIEDKEIINGYVELPNYGPVTLDAYMTLTYKEDDLVEFTVMSEEKEMTKQIKMPLLSPYMTIPFYAPDRLTFGDFVMMECSHALLELMMQDKSVGPRHLGYIRDYRPIKPSTPQNLIRTVVVADGPRQKLRKIGLPYINDGGLYTFAIVEFVSGSRVNNLTHLRSLLDDKTIMTLRINDKISWKLTFVDGELEEFTKMKSSKITRNDEEDEFCEAGPSAGVSTIS